MGLSSQVKLQLLVWGPYFEKHCLPGLELVPHALVLGGMNLREIPGDFTSPFKSCGSLFAAGYTYCQGSYLAGLVARHLAAELRVGDSLVGL